MGSAVRRASSDEGPEPLVRVRVLGGFDVSIRGRPIARPEWQRASAERLFKLLLVTPGHRVSREVAAETLWPEADPDLSRTNLRKALHFARHALAEADPFEADGEALWLDGTGLVLDLDEFEEALGALGPAAGGTADPEALDRAVRLGAHDLLPDDRYEEWLVAPRERLRDRWQRLAMIAARRAQEARRFGVGLEVVAMLLARDTTDEAAHRLAIELYAAEGRHHAARRQFEQCKRALRDELDAEPSETTIAAFREAERAAERRATRPLPGSRLVARHAELAMVEPLFDRTAEGRLGAAVIRGPAGIGKTRLLQEVVAYGSAANWRVIEWQAVEATRALPYGPFRFAFASAVAPESLARWREPARSAIAAVVGYEPERRIEFADRAAFVAGLVAGFRELASACPLLLAVDDVQWLDEPSVELLTSIVAGLPDLPALIVVTYRDDETVPGHVAAFVDQVRHSGGMELAVGPLATRDIEPLIVSHFGGETVQPELARVAFDRSLGNPLFCLELLRAGRESGSIAFESGRWIIASDRFRAVMPQTVRNVVATRCDRLPTAARELLATAAELGPDLSIGTLEAALPELRDDLLDTLDLALSSGLLVEQGGGYAFAHPLFRLAMRDVSGSARRAQRCLTIAAALAGIPPHAPLETLEAAASACADPLPIAGQALTSAELGNQAAMPLAIVYGFAAADLQSRLFDRAGAVALYERSIAVWRRLRGGQAGRFGASVAFVKLGNLVVRDGRDDAAEAAFRDAVAVARSADELAAAYGAWWWLPYQHGNFEAALAILDEARCRLTEPVHLAQMERDTGWCLMRLRRYDEALPMLEHAAASLEACGDIAGATVALDFMGATLTNLRRPEEAVPRLERALAMVLERQDLRMEWICRTHLCSALTDAGRPARARPHIMRAIDSADLIGDHYGEAVACWSAAEMEDALGNFEAAMTFRRRELELLTGLGGNPHNEALAHAHLACLLRALGRGDEAEAEAAQARELARRSPDPAYPARIENALAVTRWTEIVT